MSAADTIAGLRAARALIEKGWTQRTYARDANGNVVEETDGGAVAFCAAGACWAVSSREARDALRRQVGLETNTPDWPSISAFNDAPDRTQQDVLALFDRTIARLEAEAAS